MGGEDLHVEIDNMKLREIPPENKPQYKVSVSWHLFDGDDVKLVVDNEIEKNISSQLWKYWAWHASLTQIITGIKRERKEFIKNLPQQTHYIEFWADRTPTLHNITLDLGDYNSKRIPTVDDP